MDLSQKNNKGVQLPLPLIVIGAVAIIIGGLIIGGATSWVLPVQASTQAERTDQLFRVMLTIGGAIFLLVQGMLLYSIIRFRARPDDTTDGPNIHGNVTLEIVWTAIPAVIVFGLSIYSWQTWVINHQVVENEMVVDVVAQRYNWSFTYTDPLNRLAGMPPEQQEFNSGVMYTFVGQPMLLRLNSRDVNHAFWVPTMRIKQDVLPGRETEVRFTPTRAGRYRVVCAELCGGGHGGMFTYIIVYETEEEYYSQFLDLAVDRVLNPPDDPILIGENLLSNNVYPCSGCHLLDSLNWTGVTGPTLNGIGSRAGDRATASGQGSAEAYLAHSMRQPNDYIVPGFAPGIMPQFGPTEAEPAVVDGAYYRYMPEKDLLGIVSYLCTQTASGNPEDTACGDQEAIAAVVAEQSQ